MMEPATNKGGKKKHSPPAQEMLTEKKPARPITVMEPATNEGGKKKHSPPAQEMPAKKKPRTARGGSPAAQEIPIEKKPKIASTAREGSSIVPKFVIDLTSSKGEKERTARFVPVTPIAPKVATSIAERIAQHRSSSMPQVSKFVPKCSSGAKSGSPLERLATMKSDKVPLHTKVAPKPVSSAAATYSSANKKETAHSCRLKESTKTVSGELAEICTRLKLDLLEDMDICAKFVDGIK
ncbi:hypothetical protein COP1_013328 [Malus domestica]